MKRLSRRGIFMFLAVMGPGIITAAADNDAGGITTYSRAGALYGYQFLSVLLLTVIVLAVVQEMSARMGAVTQKGLGELIREEYGVKWTFIALSALLIANLATTVSNFAGIAASLEIFNISRYITVPIAAIVLWFLVVKGNFKTVERVFLFFTLIYGTYIVSGILAKPDWELALRSAVTPTFVMDKGYIFLMIAVIGTTITPWMQFLMQATVVDKGVHIRDYKYQKIDVYLGAFLTGVVAFFIIVATAATLHRQGIQIDTAADAAHALRPLAGKYAELLFAIGLFNASLLAAAVVPLSTAYTYSGAFGWEIGVSRSWREAPAFYGIYTFSIIFGAVVVLFPNLHLIDTMIRAQGISGILLPVVLIFMLLLVNNKSIMGNYTNSKIYNIMVWAMTVALIILTILLILAQILGWG
ncbi:MAG: divalent metal cation transporter [Armatimonadota bacterium]|nr:divalent metal cation transporter [Armatimonadota bacterium]